MLITIDRFEGEFGLVELEDGSIKNMPIYLIPQGAKEGDIIEIKINEKESLSRKERIEDLCQDLWE